MWFVFSFVVQNTKKSLWKILTSQIMFSRLKNVTVLSYAIQQRWQLTSAFKTLPFIMYTQCTTKHILLSQITLQVLCICLFRRVGVCLCYWTSPGKSECHCYKTGGANPAGNSSAAPVPALGSGMERLPQLRQAGSSSGLQSSSEHSYCKEKPTL